MRQVFLVAIILALTAQTPADPSTSSGQARLDMFAGTWSGVGSMNGAAGAAPTQVTGTNKCTWSDGKVFLICDGTAHFGGKTFHGISVFNYDPDGHAYRFLNINSAGANRTALTLEGNTWSFDDQDKDAAGKITFTRTLNIFDSPDKYRFIQQTSPDKVHWTTTGSGVSTQVP